MGYADRAPFDPVFSVSDAQFEGEELIELQPVDRSSEIGGGLREMDRAERPVLGFELLGLDHVRGERVRDGIQPLERPEDELPNGPRSHALRRSVNRRDPADMDRLGIILAEDLDLLVGKLQAPSIGHRLSRDGQLQALAIGRGRPGLVEEREIEIACAVIQGDRHHRLPSPRESLCDPPDAPDHRDVLPDTEGADGDRRRAVDVAAGVVPEEVAHRTHAQAIGERLPGGRAPGPHPNAPIRHAAIDVGDRAVQRERTHSTPIRKG